MTHLEFPPPGDPAHEEAHRLAHEHEMRRRRWKLISLVVAVVLLLIAAAGVVWYYRNRPIEIPNVTRMTQEEASDTLQGVGLSVGAVTETATDAVASGRVVSQRPSYGIAVDKGAKVDLVVAVEPRIIDMPDLAGVSGVTAEKTLEEAQLLPLRYAMYSSTVTAGLVAGQLPAPGSPVLTGSRAAYYVSLGGGSGGVEVPNVVGLVYTEAIPFMRAMGLDAVAFYENVTEAPQGEVLAQYPPGGTRVSSDAAVALLVSVAQ